MSVVHFLFPADSIGVGDFLLAAAGITIALTSAHRARMREHRPISPRTMRRLLERLDEQQQVRR
jgi:hypothetical protein